MRRSIAQKYIKQFIQLGVDPVLILDFMLYNIELGQAFSKNRYISQETFFRSMFKSFEEAYDFANNNVIFRDAFGRFEKIVNESLEQDWFNKVAFERVFYPDVD